MINKNENEFECSSCYIVIDWEDTDQHNGNMWGCEQCENYICSKCIEDREHFYKGIANLDLILCNQCADDKDSKMKKELTLKQITRRNFVDNEIYKLVALLNPTGEDVLEYDEGYIGKIRDFIFYYHSYYRMINQHEQVYQYNKLKSQFYPEVEGE